MHMHKKLTSHRLPENPTGQMHLNMPIMLTHSPPLRHGEPAHSSMSVSQLRPGKTRTKKEKTENTLAYEVIAVRNVFGNRAGRRDSV